MTGQALGQSCAILTALTWAIAMVFFKLSGERVAPLALNLFKNVVGLVLLGATMLVWRETPAAATDSQFGDIAILFISGFVGIALADTLFFRALNLVGVSVIAIIDCLYSPCIIFFSFLMLSEALGPYQYVGAAMILSAVLVSSRLRPPKGRTHGQLIAGILLGSLSMLLMGFAIVLAKPVLERSPVVWATTMRMLAGTVSLALFALASRRRRAIWSVFRPAAVWKWSMPGAVLGAYVSMILWVAGFKLIDASVACVLNQTSTVFAIILATLFLKEAFTSRKLLAAILAMGGVILVTLNSQ